MINGVCQYVSWDKYSKGIFLQCVMGQVVCTIGGVDINLNKKNFQNNNYIFFNSIKIIQRTAYKYKYRDHQFVNVINSSCDKHAELVVSWKIAVRFLLWWRKNNVEMFVFNKEFFEEN